MAKIKIRITRTEEMIAINLTGRIRSQEVEAIERINIERVSLKIQTIVINLNQKTNINIIKDPLTHQTLLV